MLAEPKRKTVWTLNPRGRLWSDDKNKFGQKYLESMGWSEGKGLGKHENGMKDHIKVQLNSDNKGLGYKPTADDQWIANNDNYDEILAQLAVHHNNGSVFETKFSNLEEKSKNTRNRVHYHKFIRSKNLSQCSEKDLSSIFPKKQEKTDKEIVINSDPKGSETENTNNTFESNKNINEYFRLKMEKLKNKFNSNTIQSNDQNNNHSNDNNYENNNDSDYDCVDSTIDVRDNDEECDDRKKEKKNKRKKEKLMNQTSEQVCIQSCGQEIDNQIKKNKKHKLIKVSDDQNMDELSMESSQSIANQVIVESKVISHKTKNSKKSKRKNKLRVPKGYDKQAINGNIEKYHKICLSIENDKALKTSNLISLHGYGYESDKD